MSSLEYTILDAYAKTDHIDFNNWNLTEDENLKPFVTALATDVKDVLTEAVNAEFIIEGFDDNGYLGSMQMRMGPVEESMHFWFDTKKAILGAIYKITTNYGIAYREERIDATRKHLTAFRDYFQECVALIDEAIEEPNEWLKKDGSADHR